MVFTNNVGRIFSGLFTTPFVGIGGNRNFVDTNGNIVVSPVITASSNNIFQGGGYTIQIGEGTTPATNLDFNIEDPFQNAPESLPFGQAGIIYIEDSGEYTQASTLTNLQEAGAISEVVTIGTGKIEGGAVRSFLMIRNNIDPVVNFIIGETVNLETKVTI